MTSNTNPLDYEKAHQLYLDLTNLHWICEVFYNNEIKRWQVNIIGLKEKD